MGARFAGFDFPDDEIVVGLVSVRITLDGTAVGEHHPIRGNADRLTPRQFAAMLRNVADAIELADITTVADIDTTDLH